MKHARWAPAAVLGLLFLGNLVWALSMRLPYPYDLEWMEGGMLAHAVYLERLYAPPDTQFVPFVYPPGYPALLALLGPSPMTGRLLSVLGTMLAALSLASIPSDRRVGAVMATSFVATWNAGGAFFDLVRPDGLALGLLAVGIAMVWHGRRGAAVPLVLAFFMKQSMGFFLPAVWLAVASRDGIRAGAVMMAATLGPILLGLAGLAVWSDGLVFAYLFAVPASHPVIVGRLFPLAWLELGAALPLTTAATAAFVLLRARGSNHLAAIPVLVGLGLSTAALVSGDVLPASSAIPAGLGLGGMGALAVFGVFRAGELDWRGRFLVALAGCALISTVWMRAHHGGYLNVLIPGFWVLALGAAVVLSRVPSWVAVIGALQLGLQVWTTPFDALMPTEHDVRAGDELVSRLKAVDGPVWSPYAVWLPTYAGHAPQAHLIGVWDLDHPDGPLVDEVQVFTGAIREHHWGAVVTSQRELGFGLKRSYRLRTRLHHAGALRPKSGWPVQLTGIWTPKQ